MLETNPNVEIKPKKRRGKFGRPEESDVGIFPSNSPHSRYAFESLGLGQVKSLLKKVKNNEKNENIENIDPNENIQLVSPGGRQYSPQLIIGRGTVIATISRHPSSPTSFKEASKELSFNNDKLMVNRKLNFANHNEQVPTSADSAETESGIPWDFFQLPEEKVISYSVKLAPTKIIKKGKRQPSGEQIFGKSANEIAPKLGLPEVNEEDLQKYEWLHLCAFRWTRTEGQVKENLILGTFHCNTLMMFIEEKVHKLVTVQKKKVTIEVKAIIDCSTPKKEKYHLAKEINYTVKVKGYAQPISITFNPQQHKRPAYDDEAAIDAVFKVEELREQNKADEESSSLQCSK